MATSFLATITNLVCDGINQTDDVSKAYCDDCVNRRYSTTIWNAHLWKDAEMQVLVGISETNVIDMPEGMQRVISIQVGADTFLDPTNYSALMQTDPGIFDRFGTPTSYTEFYDPDSESGVKRRIKVFPQPQDVISILITGKRVPDVLENDSVGDPLLRNVTDALISFATGDMYRRLKQIEKADHLYEEANAALKAAIDLETLQSNRPRQIKQLTVSGNSLAELRDAVCNVTSRWGLDDIVSIDNFLRRAYQQVWDACNWVEANVEVKVNTDGGEIVLPPYVDRILQVRCDPLLGSLEVVEPQILWGISPQIFEQTGTSWGYATLTSVGVAALPPTREKLSIYSTSPTETGNVFVMGESNGNIVSENVTITPGVTQMTVNEYDVPLTISKGITTGDIVVSGNTTGTELVRLLTNERERKHMRIWLQPEPDSAQIALILGKRTMMPFVQDEDTPFLRNVGNCLIAGASAAMFAKVGDPNSAATFKAQFEQAMQTMMDLETRQNAFTQRVLPWAESDCGYMTVSKGYI